MRTQPTLPSKRARPEPLQHRTSPALEALVRRERVVQEAISLALLEDPEATEAPEIGRAHLESALDPRCGAPLRRAVGFGGG